MKYFLTFFISYQSLFSQGWPGSACTESQNNKVKKWYNSGKIGEFGLGLGDGIWWGPQISSSYLKAEGIPPKIDPEPHIGSQDYDRWTCMYSAHSAIGKNNKTAWCEGKDYDGEGEIIIFSAPINDKFQIRNGVSLNSKKFSENNRIKELEIKLFLGKNCNYTTLGNDALYGFVCKESIEIAKSTTTLLDIIEWQELRLPNIYKYKIPSNNIGPFGTYNTFIGLKILSVYPGTRFRDTCISGIEWPIRNEK